MLRKLLLIGAAAGVLGAVAAPAMADNIATDTWYAFGFTSSGSALFGPGFAAGTNPGGVMAPSAPWTITLSGPATLTVTDVEASGDRFAIYDNSLLLGTTSAPTHGHYVGECISCALGDSFFSSGTFLLGAGSHSLTGVFLGDVGYGDGDFMIHSAGVPEPTAWALMLIGFGGMGAALRSRRRMASAIA